MREITKGSHPPAGLHGGSCSQSGQLGHSSSWIVVFMWMELVDCSMEGPMLKYGYRSLIYKDAILVFGGEGSKPDNIYWVKL